MNKRVSFLLASLMVFTNVNTVFAIEPLKENSVIGAASSYLVTTGGAITTTDSALKCGITDKVITTEKGTIEILDDGTIITTGETTYNPQTGNFDIKQPHYTNYEKIYINEEMEEVYSGSDGIGLRYGKGEVINKNYTFLYNNEIYTIDKGSVYTRRFIKDDDVKSINIMPGLSFMVLDGKWFLFETSTVLYPRYTGEDAINEIVVMNQVAVILEEDTLVGNDNQEMVLPKGSMLITTEGRSSYITNFGEIPRNTIVNKLDGSVELLHEQMYIVEKNVNVRVQNMNCDNMDVEFRPFTINFEEQPPVDTDKPPVNNDTPNTPNTPSTPSYDDTDVIVNTTQKLSKDKQYEYNVTGTVNLTYKNEVIKLTKNDRIILPRGLEKIGKTLPYGTLIIKSDGNKLVLKEEYVTDRQLRFVESKEMYLAFVFYINNKPYEFVIRLK